MNRVTARPTRQFVCAYSYTNAAGREVFQHVRWRVGGDGKSFSYRWRIDPAFAWVWEKHPLAGEYLYRLPELLAAKAARATLWWAEGEKDAEALVAAGQVATTHHGGATKATPEQAAHFRGHTGWVVVLADNDPHGTGARCALRRVELLRGVGIPARRIRIGRAAVGKDAADHLAGGLGISDFVWQSITALRAEVAALPVRAPGGKVDGYWTGRRMPDPDKTPGRQKRSPPFTAQSPALPTENGETMPSSPLTGTTPEEREAWGYTLITPSELAKPVPPLKFLINGLWPVGSYGPWGGAKKTLKTYCASIAAVAVAAGVPAFNNPAWAVRRPRPVIYYGGEGGQDMHRRRLQRIAGEVYGLPLEDLPLYLVTDIGSLASEDFECALYRNLDEVKRACRPRKLGPVGLVVLDSLYNYHPANVEVANLYERGRMLADLSAPLTKQGTALWVVDHFNKAGKGIDLDRLAQSGMSAWSDSWMLFEHAAEPRVAEGIFELSVGMGSRQWGGEEWTIRLDIGRFDKEAGAYVSSMKVETWEGLSSGGRGGFPTSTDSLTSTILTLLEDHPDTLTKENALHALAAQVTAGSKRMRAAWDELIDQRLIRGVPVKRARSDGQLQTVTVWGRATGDETKTRLL